MPSLGSDNNIDITIETQATGDGATKAESALGGLKEKSDGLFGSFGQLTKAFLFGNILFSLTSDVALKLKDGFSQVIDASKEWQSTQAQLSAVLQSTHGAVGITKDDAIGLAEAIQKTTPVSRDSALAAENMLLTFTSISKDAFPGATKAVVDMATAMNGGATPSAQQLRETAIQVGKALQDPATGMMNLRREGVNFTKQQVDMVKNWEATGQSAKAQQYIIGELAKEFGGSATKAAGTFSGQMQMLKNHLIDLGISGVQRLTQFLGQLWKWWEQNRQKIEELGNKVIGFLKPSFEALMKTVEGMMPTLKTLWNDVLKPLAEIIGVAIVVSTWIFINVLNFLLQALRDVVQWGKNVGDALVAAYHAIIGAWQGAVGFFSRIVSDIKGIFSGAGSWLWQVGVDLINGLINGVKHMAGAAVDAVKNVGKDIVNGVKSVLHIFSPSQVFHEIGQNISLGMANGITSMAHQVGNAANGLAAAALSGTGNGLSINASVNAVPGSTTSSGGGGNTFQFGDIYLGSPGAVNQFTNWIQQLNNDGLLAAKGLTVRQGR